MKPQYQRAFLKITDIATFIAAYHYIRILHSCVDVCSVPLDALILNEAPVLASCFEKSYLIYGHRSLPLPLWIFRDIRHVGTV